MPKIINAYSDANGSVADSLKSLGDSMFGHGAQNEVFRQTAREKRRHNESAPLAADAFRQNNPRELGAQFIMGDRKGPDFNDYYRGGAAIASNGNVDDPNLQTAILANAPASATPIQQSRDNAQRERAQHYASDRSAAASLAVAARQAEADERKDESKLVSVYTPNGVIQITNAEAKARLARGEELGGAPLHKDQVVGGFLQRWQNTMPAQPIPTPTAPGEPPAAPPSPFAGVPEDIKALIGVPHQTAEQQNADRRSNMPVPEAPTGDPKTSVAAQQAATTTGLVPAAQHHANAIVGAIPGGQSLVQGVTGSPQIGPEQEAARSAQSLRNNRLISTFYGFPGRPPVYAQELANRLMPKGPAIGNPATEQQHVEAIVEQLRGDRVEAIQNVNNQALPPAKRAEFRAHLQTIDRDLRMLLTPQSGGPAQAAPETRVLGNQTYFKQNGQWFKQ